MKNGHPCGGRFRLGKAPNQKTQLQELLRTERDQAFMALRTAFGIRSTSGRP